MKKENAKKQGDTNDKLAQFKVMTPTFRVSYPAVFEPKAQDGGELKYGIVMLFDKNTDLTEMKRAALRAKIDKWGNDKSKWPKGIRSPFRDGDEKSDKAGYADTIFVSAKSKKKPGLINGRKEPIEVESDFYAGCYARATLIAFAYETKGNKGISFALLNIQKVKDGESLAGRRSAAEDFDAIEGYTDGGGDFSGDESDDDFGDDDE